MRAVDVIALQISALRDAVVDLCESTSQFEWTIRVVPGVNLVGFILWHAVRSQDSIVQTCIRGIPEVVVESRWAGEVGLSTPGDGYSFTLEQADSIANSLRPQTLIAYANAVHDTLIRWLGDLREEELGAIPDILKHASVVQAYQIPAYQAELMDTVGQTTAQLLVAPCIRHCLIHVGEARTLRQLIRTR